MTSFRVNLTTVRNLDDIVVAFNVGFINLLADDVDWDLFYFIQIFGADEIIHKLFNMDGQDLQDGGGFVVGVTTS